MYVGIRIDYSRTRFLCHELHEVYDTKSIYAIEVRLKDGYYLDHLDLTLFSGDKRCQTSSIYGLYSGQSYIFDGPLLRGCQSFVLPFNEYSYYIPMNYGSAIGELYESFVRKREFVKYVPVPK